MKTTRLIQIVIYAIVLLLCGSLVYRALFASGGGISTGHPYGNVWVSYSVEERGIIDSKVNWLVVTPEQPKLQTYSGDEGLWSFSYENGKEFSFQPDSKNLFWIDPESGSRKIFTSLTKERIQRIIDTRPTIGAMKFKSGEEFLAWLDAK